MKTPTITSAPAVVYVYNGRRSIRRRTAAMRAARQVINELTRDCDCESYDPETGYEGHECRFHSWDDRMGSSRNGPPRERRLFEWLVKRIVNKFKRAEAAAKARGV